jgi:galactokinase
MAQLQDPRALLAEAFGPSEPGREPALVSAPGRVNLIGEHIDYHGLPVLPIAIRRSVRVAFRPRADGRIRAVSAGYGVRDFGWTADLAPTAAGDWENYLRAAACAVGRKWGTGRGVDAAIVSDLPPAAGLSSSSALIVAFTLSLLRANGATPTFEELMEVLPEGEQFVGTRGGGMDHAAVVASKAGCALLVEFGPLRLSDVPIPDGWSFLVAHSLKTAEKSGGAREHYNSRRVAGQAALNKLGIKSYREVAELPDLGALSDEEKRTFRHVVTEGQRVCQAVAAMRRADKEAFGELLCESHRSMRDDLQVSCGELDELVEVAMKNRALGARLTGAGFGGCAIVFCEVGERGRIAQALVDGFYAKRSGFVQDRHLIFAEPSAGALHG